MARQRQNSSSANAKTISDVLIAQVKDAGIDQRKLASFSSDGGGGHWDFRFWDFSCFIKNASGFSVLVPDVVFGFLFSYLDLFGFRRNASQSY